MPYYHIRITPKSDQRSNIVKLDLSKEALEKRVLFPYRKGVPITFRGRTVAADEIECIRINRTEQDSEYFWSIEEAELSNTKPLTEEEMYHNDPYMPLTEEDIAAKGEDVTDDFITGPPGGELYVDSPDELQLRPAADARDVFVVHGRNEKARVALFEFLRSIGLYPVEWSEAIQNTGKASPYIGDILNAAFSRAHAVVVLLTLLTRLYYQDKLDQTCFLKLAWQWVEIKTGPYLSRLATYGHSATLQDVTRCGLIIPLSNVKSLQIV